MSIARVILLLIVLLVFPGKLSLEEFCCCDKLDKPSLHSSLNTGRKCSRHLAETPVSEILHARRHGCALRPLQHFLVPALQLGVLDLNLSSISHLWISASSKVAGDPIYAFSVIEMESWAVTVALNWISFLLWFNMKKLGFEDFFCYISQDEYVTGNFTFKQIVIHILTWQKILA